LPLTARGADRAELQLAANPGEPLGALSRVASGGELSRVLLALHAAAEASASAAASSFSTRSTPESVGPWPDAVGARLRRLAARNQVLCVTHLPQVARTPTGTLPSGKRFVGGRTLASVTPLDEARSVDELARMVGGREATEVLAPPRVRDFVARRATARRRSSMTTPPTPRIAVYPGNVRPGHERAPRPRRPRTTAFRPLRAAILRNEDKQPMFTVDERTALLREAVAPWSNVSVEAFDGLLVNYAQRIGAHVILRESARSPTSSTRCRWR
jgi:hypothetical protein